MDTEQEIMDQGAHLAEVFAVISGAAMVIMTLAPEIASHTGQEHGEACMRFAAEVLKPVIESLDGQLRELRDKYLAAHGEVESLEAMLKLGSTDV